MCSRRTGEINVNTAIIIGNLQFVITYVLNERELNKRQHKQCHERHQRQTSGDRLTERTIAPLKEGMGIQLPIYTQKLSHG
jgi:hypothetical protein